MTEIKKTLIEMVRDVLNALDSEDVNSINDSVEAQQVARIIQQVYYNHISGVDIPEHANLIQLTAASDSTTPTHFTMGSNVQKVENIWYATDASFTYREICYLSPLDFIKMVDSVSSNYVNVTVGGTNLRIRNDKNPEYYTTFNDETIIMDSYKATTESTLQESKVRAYGYVIPEFSISDSYRPDIDANLYQYIINEAISTAYEWLKGGPSQKAEQAARRSRARVHGRLKRTGTRNGLPNYGRR